MEACLLALSHKQDLKGRPVVNRKCILTNSKGQYLLHLESLELTDFVNIYKRAKVILVVACLN